MAHSLHNLLSVINFGWQLESTPHSFFFPSPFFLAFTKTVTVSDNLLLYDWSTLRMNSFKYMYMYLNMRHSLYMFVPDTYVISFLLEKERTYMYTWKNVLIFFVFYREHWVLKDRLNLCGKSLLPHKMHYRFVQLLQVVL